MSTDLILKTDFHNDDSEKTKLNWFFYEYALEILAHLNRDKRIMKKLKSKKYNDQRIAKFCIEYSKSRKPIIMRKLAGEIDSVYFDYRDIEAFFPDVGDKVVDDLLHIVAAAWDFQLSACEKCPTRCISEKERIAPMFDDDLYA